VEIAKYAMEVAKGTVIDGRQVRCEHARVNRTVIITTYPGFTMDKTVILAILVKNFGPFETVEFPIRGWLAGKGAVARFQYRQDAINFFGVSSLACE